MSKRLNRDDIDKFHDFKLYVPTRTIYMGSETADDNNESGTDALMAERFIKNLIILDNTSNDPITVIMNNIGGDEYHGMAIYDAIRHCASEVTIKVFGHAMSMGSVILQAAHTRLMSPNSRQMIHYGTMEISGHAKTVQRVSKEYGKLDQWMERVYLERIQEKHPAYTLEQLKVILDHDTFLTAKESIAIGLADAVLPEPISKNKQSKVGAKNGR